MRIDRFEDLRAWQAARELTHMVYTYSRRGEFGRDYGLRDQICRAAASVMANIAEGFDCDTDGEFRRFLGYARRSATEVQSHGYAALDQAYLSQADFAHVYEKAREAKSLIGGLVRYLRNHPRQLARSAKAHRPSSGLGPSDP